MGQSMTCKTAQMNENVFFLLLLFAYKMLFVFIITVCFSNT